tara:strand:+ start:320 stop:868 length:549 start_codon:yes stop_codon:yes gene_type:complete
MKLNKETLKRIIKEELEATLRESMPSGGTDYYNKLVTLMGTKAGVYQAESLYEFARDQLDDEEKTFLDNCFRFLEIGREATKIGNEIKEIGKQIREYLKENPIQSWEIKKRENDVFLKEMAIKEREMYKQIRELNDLFSQHSSKVGDSVGRMVKENPRVYAFFNSREVGVEEASGHFGMLSI